jgi:hypothetical protein
MTLFNANPDSVKQNASTKNKQPTCKPQSMNFYYIAKILLKPGRIFSNVSGATPTKHLMAIGLL